MSTTKNKLTSYELDRLDGRAYVMSEISSTLFENVNRVIKEKSRLLSEKESNTLIEILETLNRNINMLMPFEGYELYIGNYYNPLKNM